MDKALVPTEESAGAVICRCSVNKSFGKIAQNSQENTFNTSFSVTRLHRVFCTKMSHQKVLFCHI